MHKVGELELLRDLRRLIQEDLIKRVDELAGTYWRLMGKTYDLAADLTTLTFESERLNKNWFRADLSTTDGPDIVW